MKSLRDDVLAFHSKHDCHSGTTPAIPPDDVVLLRKRLLREEFIELTSAMNADDLPGVAKEAIDLIYVTVGTLIAYGIDPIPIWAAVAASNLSKDGSKRGDHKVLKGEGYIPPDIEGLLAKQGAAHSVSALTPGERVALAELEYHIRSTGRSEVIGVALCEIRDRHLYRDTHRTFDEYVSGVWGFSPQLTHLFLDSVAPRPRFVQVSPRVPAESSVEP